MGTMCQCRLNVVHLELRPWFGSRLFGVRFSQYTSTLW